MQEEDLMAVVRFLRTTPNLSYDIVGELLGEPSERCCQVLELFTDSFDFSGALLAHVAAVKCRQLPALVLLPCASL